MSPGRRAFSSSSSARRALMRVPSVPITPGVSAPEPMTSPSWSSTYCSMAPAGSGMEAQASVPRFVRVTQR